MMFSTQRVADTLGKIILLLFFVIEKFTDFFIQFSEFRELFLNASIFPISEGYVEEVTILVDRQLMPDNTD